MGALGEDGQWISISEKAREEAEKRQAKKENQPPVPQTAPTPPATTDPGPQPDVEIVDEFWIEAAGRQSLPGEVDLKVYRNDVQEGVLRALADRIIVDSGIDIDDWARRILRSTNDFANAERELNTKNVDEDHVPDPQEFEPLPGVSPDPTCTSAFDVNDLALRGRKSVTSRGFNQPLIMFDAVLPEAAGANPWRFGQKLTFKQEWRHEGFTLGELVSSMSMLPGEELSVEVSSFQRTRSEIQQETENTARQQLETERKNTDERTCTNAVAASNGWSVSASASVNYPVASASLSASAYGNSSEQSEQNRRQLAEATSRAVNDLSSRRAVKLTQTAEAGSESTTTRKLRNPNPCQTVTYNFFQVVKLYNVQIRIVDDRPTLLLPGLFPLFYGPLQVRKVQSADVQPTTVAIPAHLVEGWNSPAVFLTQHFELDRDLSQTISGWALRLRADIGANPVSAARQLAEALVVAAKFLFRVDPNGVTRQLTRIFESYLETVLAIRERSSQGYGVGRGSTEQLNTGGLYVDALRGRCTACTDHDESAHYVEVMTALEELHRLKSANVLDATEAERRHKLLADNKLDPFTSDETP